MATKYRIIPLGGGGGITPSGTLNIRSEGVFDVTNYASVDVDIFDDSTTKTITDNGVYNASDDNVLGYSQVTVSVPASAVDTGTKTITANGTGIDVIGYAAVDVAVPASAVDSGTKSITANGTGIDVIGYAAVDVAVPASAVDTGTKTITANGTGIDVIGYAAVDVNVPASAVDTGTLQTSITTNGTSTSNVVGYASHEITVNVTPTVLTMTQQQYDALSVKDPDTIYLIQ